MILLMLSIKIKAVHLIGEQGIVNCDVHPVVPQSEIASYIALQQMVAVLPEQLHYILNECPPTQSLIDYPGVYVHITPPKQRAMDRVLVSHPPVLSGKDGFSAPDLLSN